MIPKTSDEVLRQTIQVYDEEGHNQTAAARRLGITRSSLQNRLERATQRGIVPLYAAQGLPPGMVATGASTLVDPATGEQKLQWVKTKLELSQTAIIEGLEQVLADYKGKSVPVKSPPLVVQDLATFYIVSDHHLGMYAWKKETGADYDVEIGKHILQETAGKLIDQTPPSEVAVVLNLGDFFHSDSNENRTRRSGNALDVDTRFQNVLNVGVYLLIDVIEKVKAKHRHVIVRNNIGNHDPYGTLALAMALKTFYSNDPRVTVDDSPNPLWFWEFGKVMVGSTHGDMIKHTDMPGVMATKAASMWGRTEHRYIYLGHVHHRSIGGGEKVGAVWETFRTLASKDGWHHQSGYSSGRSMVAITHHKETGEKYRYTETIEGPK